MTIPKFTKRNINNALKYIDKNKVPENFQRENNYLLKDGKKYPPKYVVAVADYLVNKHEIKTEGFNDIEVKEYFIKLGYKIAEYELTITAEDVVSTDTRFTMDDLSAGDNYVIIDAYFQSTDNVITKRIREKREEEISNQTLPRLACQIFEENLDNLPDDQKKNIPVCRYAPSHKLYSGVYQSVEEYEKYKNAFGTVIYKKKDNSQFVLHCWNIFSTILFEQYCLINFGNSEDKFVVVYREKTEQEKKKKKEKSTDEIEVEITVNKSFEKIENLYVNKLKESKNIILRGAPGTGKTHLAKEIAAYIVSNGLTIDFDSLEEKKEQVGFVQFHPSYDYTDFVEGLRPRIDVDELKFELRDGVFKAFVNKARKNYESYNMKPEEREKEKLTDELISKFFSNINWGKDEFKTKRDTKFTITDIDDENIYIFIPENKDPHLTIKIEDIRRMLNADKDFNKVDDVTSFFGKKNGTQGHSYFYAIYNEIKKIKLKTNTEQVMPEEKNFVFIIDEINRGEISKIFGELFFSIDPDYRNIKGEVSTQYANIHSNPDEKFYVPENVYIIGTMNDIDRSVDSFDFAMRRRFRFIEIKPKDTQDDILDTLENEGKKIDAIRRMDNLNTEILKVPDLNANYQIGASYFMKLKKISFDNLWTDYLCPLLQDYVRGMSDESDLMDRFAKAYGYEIPFSGIDDENQG